MLRTGKARTRTDTPAGNTGPRMPNGSSPLTAARGRRRTWSTRLFLVDHVRRRPMAAVSGEEPLGIRGPVFPAGVSVRVRALPVRRISDDGPGHRPDHRTNLHGEASGPAGDHARRAGASTGRAPKAFRRFPKRPFSLL